MAKKKITVRDLWQIACQNFLFIRLPDGSLHRWEPYDEYSDCVIKQIHSVPDKPMFFDCIEIELEGEA